MIVLRVTGQEKNQIEKYPEEMPEWFTKLSDQEKYEYLKAERNDLIEMYNLYLAANNRTNEIITSIEISNESLKKLRNFIASNMRYGIGPRVIIGLDRSLDIDLYTGLFFDVYFFNGHFAISPEAYIKLLSEMGGGLGFSCKFTW
jgi:hypothetical protein